MSLPFNAGFSSMQTYVQNLIMKESAEISNLIKQKNAHIYVCGDVQMAENVYQTLRWVEQRTEINCDFV